MKIVLHIGLPKTGSTTIQNCLDANADRLTKEANVAVLSGFGLGSNSYNLSCYGLNFTSEVLKTNFHLRRMNIRNKAQFIELQSRLESQFLQQAELRKPDTLIVSSEAYSTTLKSEEEVRRLISLFQEVSTEIRVVVYLRRQDEVLLSFYSQIIKAGSARPLSLIVPDMYSNYKSLLDRWSEVVGRDNLAIGLLEAASLHKGDLLEDFFYRAGVPIGAISKPPPANASLSADAIEFLRRLNQHIPVFDPKHGGLNHARRHIVTLLTRWSHNRKRLELTADQRAKILLKAQRFNAAVAREYFDREDGELFAPANQNASSESKIEHSNKLSLDDAMAIFAFMWSSQQASLPQRRNAIKARRESLSASKKSETTEMPVKNTCDALAESHPEFAGDDFV